MKTLSLLTLSMLCFLSLSAQDKKTQKKQDNYNAAIALLESGNYEFIAQKANPTGGRQIDLTTNPNYLRISGDTGEGDLPYFGRAFSAGYGSGDGGIVFSAKLEEYKIDKNPAKFRVTITFEAPGEDDNYRCTLSLSQLENVSLTIISNKKQTINYIGFIREPETK